MGVGHGGTSGCENKGPTRDRKPAAWGMSLCSPRTHFVHNIQINLVFLLHPKTEPQNIECYFLNLLFKLYIIKAWFLSVDQKQSIVTWTVLRLTVFKGLGNKRKAVWFLSAHLSNCDLPRKIREPNLGKADSPDKPLQTKTHSPIRRRSDFSFKETQAIGLTGVILKAYGCDLIFEAWFWKYYAQNYSFRNLSSASPGPSLPFCCPLVQSWSITLQKILSTNPLKMEGRQWVLAFPVDFRNLAVLWLSHCADKLLLNNIFTSCYW